MSLLYRATSAPTNAYTCLAPPLVPPSPPAQNTANNQLAEFWLHLGLRDTCLSLKRYLLSALCRPLLLVKITQPRLDSAGGTAHPTIPYQRQGPRRTSRTRPDLTSLLLPPQPQKETQTQTKPNQVPLRHTGQLSLPSLRQIQYRSIGTTLKAASPPLVACSSTLLL